MPIPNRFVRRRYHGQLLNYEIIVDEFADLMMVADKQIEKLLVWLTKSARIVFIYFGNALDIIAD